VALTTPLSPNIGSKITAQVWSEMVSARAARSLNGTWVMPGGSGSKPWVYLGWPPTATVNRVRPWKDGVKAMISRLSGPK